MIPRRTALSPTIPEAERGDNVALVLAILGLFLFPLSFIALGMGRPGSAGRMLGGIGVALFVVVVAGLSSLYVLADHARVVEAKRVETELEAERFAREAERRALRKQSEVSVAAEDPIARRARLLNSRGSMTIENWRAFVLHEGMDFCAACSGYGCTADGKHVCENCSGYGLPPE